MKAKPIVRYEFELTQMLEQRSVEALEHFIVEHKDEYSKMFVVDFLDADEHTKQIALCKLIVNSKCSKATTQWARKWLKENGLSEGIRRTQLRYYGRNTGEKFYK